MDVDVLRLGRGMAHAFESLRLRHTTDRTTSAARVALPRGDFQFDTPIVAMGNTVRRISRRTRLAEANQNHLVPWHAPGRKKVAHCEGSLTRKAQIVGVAPGTIGMTLNSQIDIAGPPFHNEETVERLA